VNGSLSDKSSNISSSSGAGFWRWLDRISLFASARACADVRACSESSF